jgi:hypothetical protein
MSTIEQQKIDRYKLSSELNKIGLSIPDMEALIGIEIKGDKIGSDIKCLIWAIIKDHDARRICKMMKSKFPAAVISKITPGNGGGSNA